MVPQQVKRAIFRVWNRFGVSMKSVLILGYKFKTLGDYFLTAAEYNGFEGTLSDLQQVIIREVNNCLSDKIPSFPYPNFNIILDSINLEHIALTENPSDVISYKVMASFYYTVNPFFEPNHDNREEEFGESLFESDLRDLVYQCTRDIKLKYGIYFNYEVISVPDNNEFDVIFDK